MRREIIALAATLVAAAQLGAQTDQPASWPVGSRVRVWTGPDRNVIGHLVELRGDTLVLQQPGFLFTVRERRVLSDSAVRVDVSDPRRGDPTNIAIGAFGGAVLGVVTTYVFGSIFEDVCPLGECESDTDYRRGIILGAVAGAVAGALHLEDRWREVSVPGRVMIAPSARGTAIGISFSFR